MIRGFYVYDGREWRHFKDVPFMMGLQAMPAPGEEFYGKAYVYTGEVDPLYTPGRVYYCKRTGSGTVESPYVYAWAESDTVLVTEAVETLEAALTALLVEKTGYGIHSGLEVTAKSTPAMSVAVSGGIRYKADGTKQVVAAVASQAVTAADAVKNRKDILYVDADGVTRYLAGGIETDAVAGARSITITVNAVEDDTITIDGETLRAIRIAVGTDEFTLDATIPLTATALYTALGLNTALAALYDITNPSDGVIVLTEKTAGGGHTPGAAAVNGDIAITSGTPTASAAAVAGSRVITITDRAEENDTLVILGQTITCINGTPGTDEFEEAGTIAETAENIAAALAANATIDALYAITNPSAGVIVLTEKTPGGGNTPGTATTTGTLAVTNATPVTSAAAVKGARTYTVTHNGAHKDTVTIDEEVITALKAAAGTDEFVPGETIALTATALYNLINANPVLSAKYTATNPSAGVVLLTETTAGGGDTPGEATVDGTVEITNGTPTVSVAHIAGDAAPAVPTGGAKLAELNVDANTTAITAEMITLARAWITPGIND